MPEKIYAVGDVPTTDALVTENESVLDRHLTVAKIGSLLDMERSSQCLDVPACHAQRGDYELPLCCIATDRRV